MPKTKSNYQVPGASSELNFILARIADRLDKLEGIRGNAEIEGTLSSGPIEVSDEDENIIHSME